MGDNLKSAHLARDPPNAEKNLQSVFLHILHQGHPLVPTSCDRTSNSGGKGTFVIFACILGLGLTRTKLAARLKIQAKMTKVPFPPEFEVLSLLVGFRGCPWC